MRSSIIFLLSFFLSSVLCHSSLAAPFFDGYYKLTSENRHVGYVIHQFSLDKKELTHTYYVYMQTTEGAYIESLQGKSNVDLSPKSYRYTSFDGENGLTLDAVVQTKKLTIKTTKNKKSTIREVPLRKGVFLSSILQFLMLKNPKGIQVGLKYTYSAVAEEDGRTYDGVAWVKKEEMVEGKKSFRVLNKFKGQKFISWLNQEGHVLKTRAVANGIEATLQSNPQEAVASFPMNKKTLELLFGKIPVGQAPQKKKTPPKGS